MFIGFTLGMCSGFSIPVAQEFGADREEELKKAHAHSIILSAAAKRPEAASRCEGTPESSSANSSSAIPTPTRHQDIFPSGRQVLCARICR